MYSNKLYIIVFLCFAIVYLVQEANAAGVSKRKTDEAPCDTCPRQGKCVPKVCCPAHVRPGSSNPECHLKNGKIGVCCYTARRHAAPNNYRNRTKSNRSMLGLDIKSTIHSATKSKWKNWLQKSKKLLDYSDSIISPDSPDYGHILSFARRDKEVEKLGEGAFLNLFAAQDLKERDAFDDEALELGYGEEGPYCPPEPICPDPPNPYRSINGQCNNPGHPTWGASNTAYERLLPPVYSDGIWALRKSRCNPGQPLASPRAISEAMIPDGDYPNSKHNLVFVLTGQFFTHDLTSAVIVSSGNGTGISCCSKSGGFLPPEQQHWACAPIPVSSDDKFFSTFGKTCMNFVRVQPAPSPDCKCGYTQPMNGATHFFDLSQLYGKTEAKQNEMRGPDGTMKIFNNYGRILPPLTDRPECLISNAQGACFNSGDGQGNQNLHLLCLHVLWTREHNRVAYELGRRNPGCSSDALFYSTKRILVGMYQHIFTDWLRLLIGPELMSTFDLEPCEGYSTAYDPEMNPSIMTEFAGAAFRLHSSVSDQISVICPKTGKFMELISTSEVMFEPKRMILRDFYDSIMLGMSSQPMQNIDPAISKVMTKYMFRGKNPFGLDIASLNIQRGRDVGLQPYNAYRVLCGLEPYSRIEDFPKSTQTRLSSVYSCGDDVDLWIGGLLEKPVRGGLVGPTFAHIIAEQAIRSRNGDRYHYQFGAKINPTAFSPDEYKEIKKASMSRVICDNSDGLLKSMPINAFLRRDLPENPPLSCDDPSIPSMDLSVFKIL